MRMLLCVAVLYTTIVGATCLQWADVLRVVFKHPASASDLNNFYRSIQALSADSLLNGSAVFIA
jgi:hypothetical protein